MRHNKKRFITLIVALITDFRVPTLIFLHYLKVMEGTGALLAFDRFGFGARTVKTNLQSTRAITYTDEIPHWPYNVRRFSDMSEKKLLTVRRYYSVGGHSHCVYRGTRATRAD